MNISNQIELSEFNVRNVSQKLIYDSYMGILRISPNTMYGRDADDPTLLLNTLVDFDNVFFETDNKNKHIEVQLSDSDGNLLPIRFVPKVFRTEKVFTGTEYLPKNLINICTFVNRNIHVSNKMTSRSTIELVNPHEKKSQLLIASGVDNTLNADEILFYPLEAPNDDDFFNNKNKLFLFNSNDSTPRHEQMLNNLYKKSVDWYTEKELFYDENRLLNHQVKVGDRLVTSINENKESVPVLYTRDYVLGHYDGHSWARAGEDSEYATTKVNDLTKDKNDNLQLSLGGRVTRLSWIRFDKLIWDYLDEVLKGTVRSTNGRYTSLGTNRSSTDFIKTLFGEGTDSSDLQFTAPILGQGVQKGIVSYHAMPFHRYWFHRCRQVANNMEQWQKGVIKNGNNSEKTWGEYGEDIIIKDVLDNTYEFNDELNELYNYYNEKLITPACTATVTPHHSLVKDFLLCDGKKISNFRNYPNISLRNDSYFSIKNPGAFAEVTLDKDKGNTYYFPKRTSCLKYRAEYPLMFSEMGEDDTKTLGSLTNQTPELYVMDEKYPRFIRGLNWTYTDSNGNVIDGIEIDEDNKQPVLINQDYNLYLKKLNNHHYVHSFSVVLKNEDGGYDYPTTDGFNEDANGEPGIDIQKNIYTIYGSLINGEKLPHTHNIEYLTNVDNHYHLGFSTRSGLNGPDDLSQLIIQKFYRQDKYYLVYNDKCLWQDPYDFSLTRGAEWANYCLTNNNVYFDNYTPVPNIGYMIFNSEIYNPYNNEYQSKNGPDYVGTIKEFEHNWSKSGYGYFDAQNNWYQLNEKHSISPTHKRADLVYNSGDRALMIKLFEKHRSSKIIRKQLAIKLNESLARIPISYQGKAQFALYGKHFHQWKRKRSTLVKILVGLVFVLAFAALGWWIGGLAWGSWIGATIGLGVGIWVVDQYLRGKWRPAWSHTYRYNIGSYQFALFGGDMEKISSNAQDGEDKTSWQCVSSLPYDDPEYLGYGDITALNTQTIGLYNNETFDTPEKYYISHNVTDLWNSYNNTKSYGYYQSNNLAVKNPVELEQPSESDTETNNNQATNESEKEPIEESRVQKVSTAHYAGDQILMKIDSPYPSHLNLLPIIRI